VQRIYVERPIFQTFLWKLVDRASKMVRGNPAEEATEVGPVIRSSDADRIESWVKDALSAGAKLVEGGAREGSVLAPTILTGTRRRDFRPRGSGGTVRRF
jgi:acyl-CoA reductase-like NAD-dependent aldehyde dehydrogenase